MASGTRTWPLGTDPAAASARGSRGHRAVFARANTLWPRSEIEGKGVEFLLVLLVPGPFVFRSRDLAGLVVFDVGADPMDLGLGGTVAAWGG